MRNLEVEVVPQGSAAVGPEGSSAISCQHSHQSLIFSSKKLDRESLTSNTASQSAKQYEAPKLHSCT